MHIKALIFYFIIGLSSLSLVSCSDDNGHGHSHAPTENSTTHDNLDSK